MADLFPSDDLKPKKSPLDYNPNDEGERALGQDAEAAIAQGKDPAKVAARLAQYIHHYRATVLPQKQEPKAGLTAGENVAGALGSAYQGLTFGAGNKIMAGVRTALPEALGGQKGWDYGQALRDVTAPTEAFHEEHPVAAKALELAGSIPTIAATGGASALRAGMSPATRALVMAREGAKYGALSGGLSANRWEDVPGGVVRGATTGAVAGPVLGTVAPPIVRGAAKAVRGVAGMFGAPTIGDVVATRAGVPSKTSEAEAGRMIDRALAAGGVSAEDAAREVAAQTTHAPTTAMELGSAPVRGLARAAWNVPNSGARQTLDTFLEQRSAGTAPRLQEGLTAATGQAPEEMRQTVEQLADAMRQRGKPLYQAAFDAAPIPLEAATEHNGARITLGELLRRPSMQQAIAYQNKLASEGAAAPIDLAKLDVSAPTGFSAEQWAALRAKNPQLAPSAELSVEQLHNLKLRLDELIGYAKGRGAGNPLGDTPATRKALGAIEQTKNALLDILDAHSPDYAKARATWAGDASIQDAARLGGEHFAPGTSNAELAAQLKAMSPSEQVMYRRAALAAFREKVEALGANPDLPEAAKNVNVVQRLLGTGPQGERAAMLFPDRAAYETFLKTIADEPLYPKTDRFLRNQSSTAAQLAEQGAGARVSPWMIGDVAGTARGHPGAAARLVARLWNSGLGRGPTMSPAVADALATQLTETGPALARRLNRIATTAQDQAATRNRLASLFTAIGGEESR